MKSLVLFFLCIGASPIAREDVSIPPVQNQVVNQDGNARVNAPPLLLPIFTGNPSASDATTSAVDETQVAAEPTSAEPTSVEPSEAEPSVAEPTIVAPTQVAEHSQTNVEPTETSEEAAQPSVEQTEAAPSSSVESTSSASSEGIPIRKRQLFTVNNWPDPLPTFVPVPVDYFLVKLILTEIYVFTMDEIVMPVVFVADNTEFHSYSILTKWGITHIHTVVTEMPDGSRLTATPIIAQRFTALPPEQTQQPLPSGFRYEELDFPQAEIFYGDFSITFASIHIVIIIGDLPVVDVTVIPTFFTSINGGSTFTFPTTVTVPTTRPAPTFTGTTTTFTTQPPPTTRTTSRTATAGPGSRSTTRTTAVSTTRTTTRVTSTTRATTTRASTRTTSRTTTRTTTRTTSSASTPPDGSEVDLSSLSYPFVNQGAFVRAMLEFHNYVRARHGAPPVTWSSTLAQAALARSSSGQFQHTPNNPYGENIAMGGYSNPLFYAYQWYAEVNDYNFNSPGYTDSTGHFTQMVWLDSAVIGCAIVDDNPINGFPYYLTCEYSPPGNWLGEFEENVLAPNNIPFPPTPPGFI